MKKMIEMNKHEKLFIMEIANGKFFTIKASSNNHTVFIRGMYTLINNIKH